MPVAERFGVSMVPTFIFILNGKKVDSFEGANPPELVSKLEKNLHNAATSLLNQAASAASSAKSAEKAASVSGSGAGSNTAKAAEEPFVLTDALKDKLHKLIHSARIMVFIKGTPQAVKCKFSKKMVELLAQNNVKYASFDILTDNDVREGLKVYSDWKTFPQLYVDGKLIGGTDIVEEMISDGSFTEAINKAPEAPIAAAVPAGQASKSDINERLKYLIAKDRVVLFMKGSPETPRCGFSAKIVQILNNTGIKYSSFDVLSDNDVREGIKAYSNFPTFPQLYVKSQLVGGLDIVQELVDEGELESVLAQE